MSELRFFQSHGRRNPSPGKRRRLSVQPLEARRVLAASLGWDGPGLGSAELTYHIANSPSSLSQAETNAAIETALDAWSNAADITFTPTNQTRLRDSIDISFTAIDGVGGTLAQAYFPDDVNPARIAGDVQFDISDAWEVGDSIGNRAFDLVYVAVHEIGHSLGLDHTKVRGSVLAPFVSPSQSFSALEASDVAAIQGLYAAADGVTTTDTPVVESPVDETPADEPPTDETETDDTGDTDDDPFPRRRWRRGGNWHRWGGRLDAEAPEFNYVNPTDVNSDGNTSPLDALTIINHLSGSDITGIDDVAGLCDTNGDGTISALDALTVINAMQRDSASASITDDDETTEVTEVVDDTTDSVDEVDDGEETNTTETDEEDEEDEVIDNGGLVDDSDDSDVDVDDTDRSHGRHHHHPGVFSRGPFGKDAESLIARFDANDDAAVSEDEVSDRLWAKFLDAEVDADADGLVTFAELETDIANAHHTQASDADSVTDEPRHRHHRHRAPSTDAVFNAIGRGGFARFRR